MTKSSSLFDLYQVKFKRTRQCLRQFSQIHLAFSENMNFINMSHLVFYLDYLHIPDIDTLYIFLEVYMYNSVTSVVEFCGRVSTGSKF